MRVCDACGGPMTQCYTIEIHAPDPELNQKFDLDICGRCEELVHANTFIISLKDQHKRRNER